MRHFTIIKEGEGLVREKMSRFLSFAVAVTTQDEAKLKIKEFENRFHDARHVCWAYRIGLKDEIWQLSDNGEPSGTAGKPILGQLKSKCVTNALVVVVRYFGGIKLGTSGLIVAYREAAKEALENAGLAEYHDMEMIKLSFPYENMENIMKVIKSRKLNILDREFDNICKIQIEIITENRDEIIGELEKAGAFLLN